MRTLASFPWIRALLPLALCAGPIHALQLNGKVTAYRVSDGAFTLDGKPDSLWRSLLALGGAPVISFQDYSKMVILQPETARNDNPAKYRPNPPAGSATLIAAYDSQALYFYFLIKTGRIANPAALGCQAADLWKIDAAEVYVDPSPWSADPLDYHTYFTADAAGLVFGTSPRTIQVDKPIASAETRVFYRDRKTSDRFQAPASAPGGIEVKTARSPNDTALAGVEMRIPFWSSPSDFSQGNSVFISWGFNLYGDSARANCSANPLAYRWAKNFLDYDNQQEKPPGWRENDSTHYDPSRSWDGWGQFSLDPYKPANACRSADSKAVFEANWNAEYWISNCRSMPTTGHGKIRLDAAGMPVPSRLRDRDARGRRSNAASPRFALPGLAAPLQFP